MKQVTAEQAERSYAQIMERLLKPSHTYSAAHSTPAYDRYADAEGEYDILLSDHENHGLSPA